MVSEEQSFVDECHDESIETVNEVNKDEEELTQLTQQYARLQADFDNYKRRSMNEKGQLRQVTIAEVFERFLPIIDVYEKALAFPVKETDENLMNGFHMIYCQIKEWMNAYGIEEIPAEGAFDVTCHQVVSRIIDPEKEEDTILHVARKGYRMRDVVIRPADVIVASQQ